MHALVVEPGADPSVRFVADRPEPNAGPAEALVAVRLAGICSTDLEIAAGYMRFTGIPGHEFVGTVLEGPGELCGRRVVGEINCICDECDVCRRGLSTHCPNRTVIGILGRDGAFAERIALPVRNCHVVPDPVPDRHAVFVEPLAAALQVTRLQDVDVSSRVTVIGSGRMGLLIAQVLAGTGCRLIVAGRNPRTLGLLRSWNIETRTVSALSACKDQDLVVECTGAPAGLQLALQLVRPRGTIVLKSTYARPEPIDLAPIVIDEITVAGNRCGPFPEAIELLASGRIRLDELISDTFPLQRGAEAFTAAADSANVKILLRPGAG